MRALLFGKKHRPASKNGSQYNRCNGIALIMRARDAVCRRNRLLVFSLIFNIIINNYPFLLSAAGFAARSDGALYAVDSPPCAFAAASIRSLGYIVSINLPLIFPSKSSKSRKFCSLNIPA